ncbi:hypothetical protein CBER1_06004 [Cercospora berteroae]|uniref:Heterokaryon incompatibility domain-containing protein n=1 Tax=Cercospora berteroae TaxID=357750 RepID=A0A2S6C4K6_9PEZI|nr:hypothetical protein CBER1_06004 [Cercospora berteroae]
MQKSPHLLAGTEIYRPPCTELQQIRLLTILPGSGGEELRCHRGTASRHHDLRPSYATISYAGGDRNCPSQQFCCEHDERLVWIDAVCINQNDVSERGAQVSSMGSIYMNGAKNLVFWSNDEEDVAETAISTWNRTYRDAERLIEDLSSEYQKKLRAGYVPVDWKLDVILTEQDMAVLEALCGLPCFRRLWVGQEAAFAFQSTCYWGSMRFPLPIALLVGAVVSHTRFAQRHTPLLLEYGSYRAARMRTLEGFMWREPRSQGLYWERFTEYLEGFSASEPRDRVYAAVQLYLQWNHMLQVPSLLVSDDGKSVSEAYRDATRFILGHGGQGGMTQLGRTLHRSSQDLAVERNGFTSWTIAFDRTFDVEFDPVPFGGALNASYEKNSAHADVHPEILNDPDPDLVIIKALLIDTVTTTTEFFAWTDANDHAQVKRVLKTLQSWAKRATIAEMLTAHMYEGYKFHFNDSSERLESDHLFRRYVFTLDRMPPRSWELHDGSTRKERHAAEFGLSFGRLASNRRFLLTRDRKIGCGPKLMQEGDVVFVAKGANEAWILRPFKEKDYWRFVGEAYVHYPMHVEIFDQEEIMVI